MLSRSLRKAGILGLRNPGFAVPVDDGGPDAKCAFPQVLPQAGLAGAGNRATVKWWRHAAESANGNETNMHATLQTVRHSTADVYRRPMTRKDVEVREARTRCHPIADLPGAAAHGPRAPQRQ